MSLLVVAAFWIEDDDAAVREPLTAERIKGSGAVVTFTSEQVDQPGLRTTLRQLQLDEAANWSPS